MVKDNLRNNVNILTESYDPPLSYGTLRCSTFFFMEATDLFGALTTFLDHLDMPNKKPYLF